LNLAREYIDGSLSRMRYDNLDRVGFLEGNNGIYAVASVIYDSLGNSLYAQEMIDQIKTTFNRPQTE
jgi:hypothetical protein